MVEEARRLAEKVAAINVTDLQSSVKNLYVCDGSVLPAPWGLPPTLSIICLALRLARHLSA
jgi:choline dehydrogenase-like flavoprotein